MMESARFDLLIVDKNLPGISGLELIAQARKTYSFLPAILITAFPEPILAPVTKLQGYLAKPFSNLAQITDTVEKVLELGALMLARQATRSVPADGECSEALQEPEEQNRRH